MRRWLTYYFYKVGLFTVVNLPLFFPKFVPFMR